MTIYITFCLVLQTFILYNVVRYFTSNVGLRSARGITVLHLMERRSVSAQNVFTGLLIFFVGSIIYFTLRLF